MLVYAFPSSASGEVRARLYTFNGFRVAELRLHIATKGEPDLSVPTRKGVSVKAKQLYDLRAAVDSLIEEYEREQAD